MKAEDVPAELVEKVLETRLPSGGLPSLSEPQVRTILAAVLPDIQAQALRDAKAWIKSSSDLSTLDGDWAMAWNLSTSHALAVLDDEAARLTETSEGTTT